MVSPTQLCWRYHSLPLSQRCFRRTCWLAVLQWLPAVWSRGFCATPFAPCTIGAMAASGGLDMLNFNRQKFFNSLASGKFEWNFRYVLFKWILVINGWGISCEISLICISLDLTDNQSTLVQVMAWCHQTTSHYLSQCWPRFLSP